MELYHPTAYVYRVILGGLAHLDNQLLHPQGLKVYENVEMISTFSAEHTHVYIDTELSSVLSIFEGRDIVKVPLPPCPSPQHGR